MTAICAEIEVQARRITTGLAHEVAMMWPLTVVGASQAVLLRTGGVTRVPLEPSEVFRQVLVAGGVAVVLAHNHIWDTGPSREDHAVTRRLVAVGAVLGIPLVAHLVIAPARTYDLISGRVMDASFQLPAA